MRISSDLSDSQKMELDRKTQHVRAVCDSFNDIKLVYYDHDGVKNTFSHRAESSTPEFISHPSIGLSELPHSDAQSSAPNKLDPTLRVRPSGEDPPWRVGKSENPGPEGSDPSKRNTVMLEATRINESSVVVDVIRPRCG